MTEQPSQSKQRKRLLLYSVLTIAALAAISMIYFLFTFDLNNYRKNAEAELSNLLSMPVTLGSIRYNLLDANLALHFDGVQIGDDSSRFQIESEKALLTLRWMELLERKIAFAKISLHKPHILIKTTKDTITANSENSQQESTQLSQDVLRPLTIAALHVVDGTLVVESITGSEEKQRFELSELNAAVTDIQLNETIQLDIKGQLKLPGQTSKSRCRLLGEIGLRFDNRLKPEPFFNLDLDVDKLDLAGFRGVFAKQIHEEVIKGTSALQLHLAGAPGEEIVFQINLSSDNMTIRPDTDYTRSIPLKKLAAKGRLNLQGERPGIRDISLQLDDSSVAGEIFWSSRHEPFSATVTILNGELPVRAVKLWLPDHQGVLQQVRQSLKNQGTADVQQAQIIYREEPEQGPKWRCETFKGTLTNLGWATQQGVDAALETISFNLNGNKWEIADGVARIGSTQLTLRGSGDFRGEQLTLSALQVNGTIQVEPFLEEWQIQPNFLHASGEIEVNTHLEGPLDRLNLDLQANLSQFSAKHSSGLDFAPEENDQLALHGSVTPKKVSLDHGSLTWASIKGHISGNVLPEEPDSLAIDALLRVDELARLTDSLPLLKSLQLHGQADLRISQRGHPQDASPEITLTLREAGLHPTSFISELDQINGRIKLTDKGLFAKDMQVHLGKSPITVQAQLIDYSEPRLLLEAKAKAVHANDLIFNSEKALLRDVDGHLEIDGDGLTFTPVDVRLDGGTNASVRGTISFHPPYDVLLDITSDFANVDEIIGLWTDNTSKTKTSTEREDKTTSSRTKSNVIIKAQAKNGNLYGMSFHDATATIIPSRERLIIHPLHFSVGEGTCQAQVITDFPTPDHPTMLKVTGHAEDVDALQVYRELLKQKNILRGKLDGDFFINGEVGANYLPSSYGNFSILVHDGVLHEFPVLSKIFSLLNVSQLFAFKLPDMDKEGMPFDRLTANFSLDKGILRTEDLKIESEAMNQSYLGELDLVNKTGDFTVAIHPLGTVDKIVSSLPVAGWLLTGENKALLTTHFSVKGKRDDFSVNAMPLDTLTEPTIGLLKRAIGLPFKLLEAPQILWGGDGTRKPQEEK